MPRYKALIEYDGTAYFGFQRQRAGVSTIQSELESVLERLTRTNVTIVGSGRTDSGVHALGQVIGFSIDWQHGSAALQRALNAHLPADIVVLQLKQVSSSFHPRYDARRRSYIYTIYNAPLRSPVQRLRSWHVRSALDEMLMNDACQALIGTHDFSTFGQAPQGNNTVREVFEANWQRDGMFLRFDITANAFLYRMVRSLVGSLKNVGDGTWTVRDFENALRACERSCSGKVAPPQGLFLASVVYG